MNIGSSLLVPGTELLQSLEFPGGRRDFGFLSDPLLTTVEVTEGGAPGCRKTRQEIRRSELSGLSPSLQGTRAPREAAHSEASTSRGAWEAAPPTLCASSLGLFLS